MTAPSLGRPGHHDRRHLSDGGGLRPARRRRQAERAGAVRWEIIQWGKERGYQWLDFGGLPERMLDDMIERGIRMTDEWPSAHRSKLAFGGEPFRYPVAVEMVRPALVRWAYDFATGNRHGQRLIRFVKDCLRRR